MFSPASEKPSESEESRGAWLNQQQSNGGSSYTVGRTENHPPQTRADAEEQSSAGNALLTGTAAKENHVNSERQRCVESGLVPLTPHRCPAGSESRAPFYRSGN